MYRFSFSCFLRILFLLLGSGNIGLAQTTFSFRTDTSRVVEPNKDSKPHIVQVQVNAVPATDVQVKVSDLLTGDASGTLDYNLGNNPVTLTFGPGRQQIQTVAIEIKPDSKAEQPETIDFTLTVPAGQLIGRYGKHTVVISDLAEEVSTLPAIRIATGTNFDYLNQSVALKNLFFGFEIFAPTAFTSKRKSLLSGFNVGFGWSQNFSSVNEGAFITGGSSNTLLNPGIIEKNGQFLYRSTRPLKRIGNDSTLVAYDFYTRSTTVNITNFNFFASSLSRFWQSADEKLDAFVALRLEGIQRNFQYNSTYSTYYSDTVKVNRRFGDVPPFDVSKLNTRYASYYDFYMGVGVPIRWEPKNDLVEIRFNPMAGVGWFTSPFHQNSDNSFNRVFYLAQLSIIEKKFGIRLGGEVRGSINSRADTSPYYTVTLSKVFTFRKVEDYLTLKKSD